MDTQLAFAFGMLAMVAIAMLAAIVVGMVKVIKLEKQLKELDRASSKEVEFLHRHMADVERGVYSELNEFKRNLQAYTDSRADKLEQKLINKKQLLKD